MLVLMHEFSAAQIHLPELSPGANTIEQVGYTTFIIRNGRPGARQRKIMGELVPYGKLWRTGAGKCSMIAFDTPVEINGRTIPAGAYALVTIPDEMEWKVMLNSDTSKVYGDPTEYDTKTEVISFKVTPGKSDRYYESLTMSIDIVRYDAVFLLSWENTQISFPIKTHSYERAVSEIRKSLKQNPDDPEQLSQASFFYFMNNDDPQQILAWLDKALQAGDERWILQQRFDILERMQKYDEATKAAERSISFLTRTKPDSWEESIQGYKERMRRWQKR
jgi:tetratricopeptide (TPR) repeat protein